MGAFRGMDAEGRASPLKRPLEEVITISLASGLKNSNLMIQACANSVNEILTLQ